MTDVLGSISALALNQPGVQITEGLLVLAAAAGVGGYFAGKKIVEIIHRDWLAYEEKKHKAQIDAINKLHKKYLSSLSTSTGAQITALPQIFQFKTDHKTIESLHYNADELDDLGTVPPEAPTPLALYEQHVLDAILKLKAYYHDLSSNDDITAGVLSYLMNILQNRCLSFAGYEYDISYLNALISFINNYASMKNTENDTHFNRLMDVYTPLKFAVQELEKHKESMSLKDMVEEVRKACLDTNNQLIRLMVRIIVPEKYDSLIETVTHKELEQDILRKKYVDIEKWGIIFKSKHEIDLPNSIFHDWIMGLSNYFLEAQDPTSILHGKSFMQPDELFSFINWARDVAIHPEPEKLNNPHYKEQKEQYNEDKKRLHDALNLIHKVFVHAPCFVNSKLHKSKTKEEFIVVDSDEDLLAAAEFIAQFGHLIHGLISLQGLCTALSSQIQELGLNFFNSKQNFERTFASFNELYTLAQQALHTMQTRLVDIDVANENVMRIAYKIELQNQMDKALKNVAARLLILADKVRHYKNKYPKTQEESTEELLADGEFFAKMYRQTPHQEPPTPDGDEMSSLPEQPLPTPEPIPPTLIQMKNRLGQLSNQLYTEVAHISDGRKKDPHQQKYNPIYDALKDLELKAINMLEEIDKLQGEQKEADPDRADKAQKLYKFTVSLYESTIEFLAQVPEERSKSLDAFTQKMRIQLKAPENNAFINRHYNGLSKWINDHVCFFPTNTRKKVIALEHAYENLSL
ncbi:hypothetical protein [Legionella rowbothamii]|uniref:hypothetical protein n=1 Tax=Legionella rowbothamii TaxID=96229 RepID=UPI001056089D|nr:hypothetical protein [Legionella rowbothamii]